MEILLSPDSEIFRIVIAILLGAFIGLRREMEQQQKGEPSFVGFRTTPLLVLLGTVSTLFEQISYLPVVAFLAVVALVTTAYANGVFKLHLIGLTSEISTLLMFWVGVLVGYQEFTIAIFLTIIIGIFNAFKLQLHKFAKSINTSEWTGGLQLFVISAAVLPFLPREPLDPWGIFVPFNFWLIVIFVSGIGFFGYFFNKFFGTEKGVLLTSFFGSIASSTAVTSTLAIEAKGDDSESSTDIYTVGILVSIMTMLIRVSIVIFLFLGAESFEILRGTGAMFLAASLLAFVYFKKYQKDKEEEHHVMTKHDIESPFEIKPALEFALLFVVVLFAIYFANQYFGQIGVLLTSFFSGFVDVDAVIFSSVASFEAGEMAISLVCSSIFMAIAVNTIVKPFWVFILSSRKFFRKVLPPVSVIVILGVVSFLL